MTNIPELLLTTLENLVQDELSRFQWFLSNVGEEFEPIAKADLERATRHVTVDKMVQAYGHNSAAKVTLITLKKLKQNQLYEELNTKLKDVSGREKGETATGKSTAASSTAAQIGDSVSALTADGDRSQAATGKTAAASSTAAEIGDSAYCLTPVFEQLTVHSVPPQEVVDSQQDVPKYPFLVKCQFCHNNVTTDVKHEIGLAALYWCCFFSFFGLVCGCCLIPFCVKTFKDVQHSCPQCKAYIGRHVQTIC